MNPALPVLAGLAGGGLAAGLAAVGKRPWLGELAIGWAVAGFLGMALLAPALARPDGIPSPAATLAALPPWQGTGSVTGGNPLLGDVTFQIEPWLLHLRGELRAGRLPFWNPYQFSGAPFWANGQSAPLHPLHLLFALLPVQLGFVLLPWLRLTIGGCGTWLLARELGQSRPAALVATAIFPLSGMLVSFVLYPMGNALALVPWVFLAVERLARGRGGAPGLAVASGFLLLGGHPETAVHTALLSALYLAVRGSDLTWAGRWLRFAGGWAWGGALAAVQLVPLALLLPETSRWHHLAGSGPAPALGLLLTQPMRLVLPALYGEPAAGTWWGPFNYSATAIYAGVLALPLAAAGLGRMRADRRILALAAVLVFSFLAAYHLPGLREILAVLPVIGRMAHHRLIFGIELVLALLAGHGCDSWLAGRGRGMLAGGVLSLVLLAAAFLIYRDDWAEHGTFGSQGAWSLAAVIGVCLLLATLGMAESVRWRLFPLLAAVVVIDLLAAHGRILGVLPAARLYPETPAVRFLAGREGRVAGVGAALRPNAALVYRLFDPRGDDPVKLERYERFYARLATGDPVYFQPIERWRDPGLDQLSVRWVMAPPGAPPAEPGWRLAYDGADARVFERPGALPMVRWTGPGNSEEGTLDVRERAPGLWQIAWRTPVRRVVVIGESFETGWRARVGGRAVPVASVDGVFLGVEVEPGVGELELRYRPPGIVAGAIASLVAALALVGVGWRLALTPFPSPGTGEGDALRGRLRVASGDGA